MGSNSCSSSSSPNPKKLKCRLSLLLCFLFLFLNFPTATAFFRNPFRKPEISYSQHCNDVVPEPPLSSGNVPVSHSNDFLSFQFAFFSGGVGIFNRTSESGISLSFNPSYIENTTSHGVHKVKATLNIRNPLMQSIFGRRRLISVSYREDDSVFSVNGYWSESSGKLCMVGSGKSYVGSFSLKYPDVVLKLNYSKNKSIYGSLIGGTLECLHMKNDYNYFEPILILGLSQNPDYEYAKVDKSDCLSAQKGGRDINLSPSKLDRGVCFFFGDQTSVHELEYWSDCGSVNCNPLRGSIEYLPYYIAYRGVRCDQRSRKVQLLLGFPNPNDMESDFPSPNATLIAEGAWDENENKFCGVACRILANASVGDCSIGFSLRFPAVMSLRNWGSMVGEIWSKKDVKDSGYFGRFGFQNWVGVIDPQGLRYEYTKIEAVRNSCAQGKEIARGTGKSYPDGFSLDMGFGLLVRNTEGKVASGFLRPQFVGDVIYVHQDELKSNHSRMLNMSYKITFLFEADGLSKLVIISAEGIYDRDIGLLCMIGCRHLDFESNDQNSIKNGSVDCETRITVQFPPLHAEQAEIAKGTIESRRSKSDPLYFQPLQLSSNSMTTTQAKKSIWKKNLGITMVVICCGGLLFGVLFKGRCILSKRLRDSSKYEEVTVIGNDKL
ncbi:hypothetical protein SO802_010580 [Lithocarpus litseifolius]|uniref:DUF2921 domain-containing protein n=1 Tax=Lithocarpus litseifolius TaxID=425828 RepID=A0AAW2DEL3_9ROSI